MASGDRTVVRDDFALWSKEGVTIAMQALMSTLDGLCESVFFFSSRRRHTRLQGDWSSDVCSSDLWALRRLHERRGGNSFFAAGVSLGGNALAKWLGERGEGARPIVDRAAIVSAPLDRKRVVWGKRGDLGGRRIIKKKKKENRSGAGGLKEECGGDRSREHDADDGLVSDVHEFVGLSAGWSSDRGPAGCGRGCVGDLV